MGTRLTLLLHDTADSDVAGQQSGRQCWVKVGKTVKGRKENYRSQSEYLGLGSSSLSRYPHLKLCLGKIQGKGVEIVQQIRAKNQVRSLSVFNLGGLA